MQNVPLPILELIASFLDPPSYANFSEVNKSASLACSSESVCLTIYENHLGAPLGELGFTPRSFKSLLRDAWKELIYRSKLSRFPLWIVQTGHIGYLKQNANNIPHLKTDWQIYRKQNGDDETLLHIAVSKNFLNIVKLLIYWCPSLVNVGTRLDRTPLHAAAYHGSSLEIIEFLLSKGANIIAKEKNYKQVPLHLAASRNHAQIVEYLISKGCPADIQDKDGMQPIHLCAQNNCDKATLVLLQKGADPRTNTVPYQSFIPLRSAQLHGSTKFLDAVAEFEKNK